jgi:undecaprenyl-diphosphatase
VGALAALTTHEPLRHISLWALITIAISGTLVGGLKLFFRRQRPPGQRNRLYFSFDHHSFPSGHAARVAALATVLGSAYPAIALPLAMWALLVGLSRVVLGVHYLLDVIVGMAAGVMIGEVLQWFL